MLPHNDQIQLVQVVQALTDKLTKHQVRQSVRQLNRLKIFNEKPVALKQTG